MDVRKNKIITIIELVSPCCNIIFCKFQLSLYEEDMTVDELDPTCTSRSPSPTKYPSRPPSRMSTLRPLTGTPHTLTPSPSPSPLVGSVSQVNEQSRAISLNDIMDNPTELEHFKVDCMFHCGPMVEKASMIVI